MAQARLIRFAAVLALSVVASTAVAALSAIEHNDGLIVLYNPPQIEGSEPETKIVRVDATGTRELRSLNGGFFSATVDDADDTLTVYRKKNLSQFKLTPTFSFAKTEPYNPPLTPLLISGNRFWGVAQSSVGWLERTEGLWRGNFYDDEQLQGLRRLRFTRGSDGTLLLAGIRENTLHIYRVNDTTVTALASIDKISAAFLVDHETLVYSDSAKQLFFARFDAAGELINPQPIAVQNLTLLLSDSFGAAYLGDDLYFLLPNYLGDLEVVRASGSSEQLVMEPVSQPVSALDVVARFGSMLGVFGVLLIVSICCSPFLLRRRLLKSPLPLAQAVGAAIPRRVVALIIDVALTQIIPFIFLLQNRAASAPLDWVEIQNSLALITLFSYLYFFLMERRSGQTLGKRLMGLRVVGIDGYRPRGSAIFMRNLLRYIDGIPSSLYLLGGFFMSFSRRGQRLGDMIGRTVVVKADFELKPEPIKGGIIDAQA